MVQTDFTGRDHARAAVHDARGLNDAYRTLIATLLYWLDAQGRTEKDRPDAPETVKRTTKAGDFGVLPPGWVDERDFAWLGRYRRLEREVQNMIAQVEA